MRATVVIVAAFVAPLCACDQSRGGGGGDDDDSGPGGIDTYCEEWSDVLCAAAERCDCLDDFGADRSACLSYVEMECDEEIGEPVESGARAFQSAPAWTCLEGVESILADCSLKGADLYPDECDEILVGLRGAGDACESDGDCQEGLECPDDTCVRMPLEGDPCLPDDECASDHFCDADGTCREYRGPGGACPEGWECDSDLYCDPRSGTCAPYLDAGEGCGHATWACGDDLYCASGSQSCAPYPREGESCADAGYCDGDLWCDEESICQRPRGAGDECADGEQCSSYECEDGRCVGEDLDEDESDCELL
ncbi:MAG: hypothetical protein HYY06_07030 [Deltaproteobacteria bacterium]|nr:hypothetical protein [Deltaproteobacteria bacterium]